jgi:PTS system cellobiose-specific IIC component
MLNRLNQWLERSFLPIASKVAGWRYMVAARNAFFSSIPFILVGSIFLIASYIAIPGWDKIVAPYLDKLNAGYNVTMGLLSVWIAAAYGYSLAQYYGLNTMVGAMASMMGFFSVAVPWTKEGNLVGTYLGGTGIFTALLVGTFAVEVYRFFVSRNITIRLPESVPQVISASFGALLPILTELVVLQVITVWLGVDIPGLITKAFQPLIAAGDSFWACVAFAFLISTLFYLGIHGWAVVMGIVGPIQMANIEANAAAHAAGQAIPHMFTEPFIDAWVAIGGTTCAAALVIWLFFCKSKQLKQVARLSAVPSFVVNVHEPAMFGVPTVLNPYFFFPVVFTQPILTAIAWIVLKVDWVTKPFIYVPWSTPEPFYPWLTTGGDWRALVLLDVNIAVALAIYYPFVMAYDKVLLKQEQGETVETAHAASAD